MSLTKKQIKLAAKILMISQAYHSDGAGAESLDENDVSTATQKLGFDMFLKLFPNEKRLPLGILECIELAKRYSK